MEAETTDTHSQNMATEPSTQNVTTAPLHSAFTPLFPKPSAVPQQISNHSGTQEFVELLNPVASTDQFACVKSSLKETKMSVWADTIRGIYCICCNVC